MDSMTNEEKAKLIAAIIGHDCASGWVANVNFQDQYWIYVQTDERVTLTNLQLLGIALLQDDRVAAACLMDDFGIEYADELDRPVSGEDLEKSGFRRSSPPAVDSYVTDLDLDGETFSSHLHLYLSRGVRNGWACNYAGAPMPDIYTLRELHHLLRAFGMSVKK